MEFGRVTFTFSSQPGVPWWGAESIPSFLRRAVCLGSSSTSSFSCCLEKYLIQRADASSSIIFLLGAVGEILRHIERIDRRRKERKKKKQSKCGDPKSRNRKEKGARMRGRGKTTENKKPQGIRREKERKGNSDLLLRKVSLLSSLGREVSQGAEHGKEVTDPQCVILETQEFSPMGVRVHAVWASALVYFIQVSCENARMKLVFLFLR